MKSTSKGKEKRSPSGASTARAKPIDSNASEIQSHSSGRKPFLCYPGLSHSQAPAIEM